jgi:aminoglycoside phosphotransferase family enzyme
MTTAQIMQLAAACAPAGKPATLIETHISWVLLTDKWAFKIKKPVQFSFLDFSTLERRHFFCQRELELNARLTSGVYLQVQPVVQRGEAILIGQEGTVIDYAIQMKRLDNTRQMHLLLEQGAVTPTQITQLAKQIATFHAHAHRASPKLNIEAMQHNFADILKINTFLQQTVGAAAVAIVTQAVQASAAFLSQHEHRIIQRQRQGFVVDGHGDLHAGNIFLLEQPIIFDCIEFNDALRQLDMLDEIAFLCLDLHQQPGLEQLFLQEYLQQMPCMETEEDEHIYRYYKRYRANIRLKVACLRAIQQSDAIDRRDIQNYLQLLQM